MTEERLQKFLARAGVASRRKAEALIAAGAVTVNGQPAILGMKVGPDDEVRLDGGLIKAKTKNVTYALYKPVAVLSTVSDDRGRKTVMDLVPRVAGLHPVGRLDYDSEGLLLLSTDGDLTLRLTHPRYQHEKEYRAWCKEGEISPSTGRRLKEGVQLEDGTARALALRPAPQGCVIVIAEGRNRQVRRMLAAVGYTVTRLKRTRIAALKLRDLKPGQYRELSHDELDKLGYTHN